MDYLKKYWWIFLIGLAAIAVTVVSLLPDGGTKSSVKESLEFLESFSVIIVGVLGLLWAYPWLKKKATESYVEKQVDIIFHANKNLRAECVQLLEKYPVVMRSNDLSLDDVAEALSDVQKLYSQSIDANYDAYRYSYLLYHSIKLFYASIVNGIPNNFHAHYYKEDFHHFLHNHIDEILQYASNVDSIARMAMDSQKKLVKKVDKYVVGNELKVIPGMDGKVYFKVADALLVLFFCNNIEMTEGMHLLHETCFKVAPNGASFARLMNNQRWYAPIQLKVDGGFPFENLKLDLVGYKQMVSYKLDSGDEEHYVVLYYSNISGIGFVGAFLDNKAKLVSCADSYLSSPVLLREDDILDMWIDAERVGVKVKRRTVQAHYKSIRRELQKKMRKEL